MADETLLMLAKEVRGKTLRLLDGVDGRVARFKPAGLNNTVLWHAGHVYTVVEHLGLAPAIGREPVMPPGWFDMFSWKSRPAEVTDWPTLHEVVQQLEQQRDRLLATIEALTPDRLDAVIGDPARARTLRFSILHALHDEANHQGELWLLKKMAAPG